MINKNFQEKLNQFRSDLLKFSNGVSGKKVFKNRKKIYAVAHYYNLINPSYDLYIKNRFAGSYAYLGGKWVQI